MKVMVYILPMRNWNFFVSVCLNKIKLFISYLWGIETLHFILSIGNEVEFISYLWGIETYTRLLGTLQHTGLYLTYEELKPFSSIIIIPLLWVYILPMRNWNIANGAIGNAQISFISYLWGIETNICERKNKSWLGLYLTYEELKLRWQVVLPSLLFSFISYLWGIETQVKRVN